MTVFEKIEALKEEFLFFKHLFLDFSDYSNFKISFPIGLVLFFMAIALPICVFFISYREAVISKIAVQLLRHEATSEERAATLSTLRLNEKKYKRAISGGGRLSAIVARAGFQNPRYEEYLKILKQKKKGSELDIDFESECFYVLPEKVSEAKRLAESDRSTLIKPIIISAGILAVLALLFIFMPEILEAMNTWIGK